MNRYNDYKKDGSGDDLSYDEFDSIVWAKYKIIVPTEEDRQELMQAFEHFHDSDIDTEYVAVNQLCHEYLDATREKGAVNNIIVDKDLFNKLND